MTQSIRISLPVYGPCTRCGYRWVPQPIYDQETGTIRIPPPPKNCANPACRSPYYDVPRGTLKPGRPAKK